MQVLLFIIVVIGAVLMLVLVPSSDQGEWFKSGGQDLKSERFIEEETTNSGTADINLEKATTAIEEAAPPLRSSEDPGFMPEDFKGPTSPPSVRGPSGNPPNY